MLVWFGIIGYIKGLCKYFEWENVVVVLEWLEFSRVEFV